jgi:phosphoserine phosphatase
VWLFIRALPNPWQRRLRTVLYVALLPAIGITSLLDEVWCTRLLATIALVGITERDAAEAAVKGVAVGLVPYLRPAVLERLEWHRTSGHRIVVLSGSYLPIVGAFCERVLHANVICTVPAMDLATGRFAFAVHGAVCIRHEKAVRLQHYLEGDVQLARAVGGGPGPGRGLQATWGYGNSSNDVPYLEMCEHPVAVSPSAALRSIALRRRWPMMLAEGHGVSTSAEWQKR